MFGFQQKGVTKGMRSRRQTEVVIDMTVTERLERDCVYILFCLYQESRRLSPGGQGQVDVKLNKNSQAFFFCRQS